MRITTNIADDSRTAAREVIKLEARPIGTVASRLTRQSLGGEGNEAVSFAAEPPPEFGFRPFPKLGGVATNELVNRLREEVGD